MCVHIYVYTYIHTQRYTYIHIQKYIYKHTVYLRLGVSLGRRSGEIARDATSGSNASCNDSSSALYFRDTILDWCVFDVYIIGRFWEYIGLSVLRVHGSLLQVDGSLLWVDRSLLYLRDTILDWCFFDVYIITRFWEYADLLCGYTGLFCG